MILRISRKRRRNMERRSRRRENLERRIQGSAGLLAAGTMLLGGSPVQAMPQGGQVAAGAAEIAQKNAEMAIRQMSQNAVINWQSFNIAAGERVNILQPNAQAAILNRVMDGNITRIMGALQANGRVFIVNPAGVLFASGAQVNVGSLVASSLNISNADFMAGRYAFVSQKDGGKVINKGELIAQNQGLVALLGEQVENDGVIVARKGTAALAAGEEVTLDFNGDGKVEVIPDKAALTNVVDNKGLVEADGGLVFMTAAAGDKLTNSVVNQSGIIKAQSLGDATGQVRLTGGNVSAERGSRIDVSGQKGGTAEIIATNRTDFHGVIDAHGTVQGGQVETSGQTLNLDGEVNIAAENGKNGSWLLDPGDITIKKTIAGDGAAEAAGSGYTGGNSESVVSVDSVNAALDKGGEVTIATDNTANDASITVEDAITKTTAADSTLTLQASGSVNVGKDISSSSGKLNVNIVSDTNSTAGGRVDIADGVTIATKGGDFSIRGGLDDQYANSEDASYAGVQLGAATITTEGGNIAIAGSNSTQNDGVKIAGTTLDAGNGSVQITGKSNKGMGISLSAASRIIGNDITLTADNAALQGTFTAAGDNSRLGFATLTAGKTISLGGSGDITLAADKFAHTDFAKIVLGNDNGNVAINGAELGTDLEIKAKGGKASVTNHLQAAGKTVTIGADSIEAAGAITADRLLLDGENAAVKLTNEDNAVGMVAGKVKSIELTNRSALAIGEAGTEALGLEAAGDPVKITALDGDISLQGTGLTTKGAGKVELTAENGALNIDTAGANLTATGKAALDLQAKSVRLGAENKISANGGDWSLKTDGLELEDGGKVATAGGKVMIDCLTADKAMAVGMAGAADALTLADTGFIDTAGGEIALGSKATGKVSAGNIETQAPLTVTSGREIAFTGGKVSGTGKDSGITFAAPQVTFAGETIFANGDGVLNFTADAFSGWENAAFADTQDKGVIKLRRQTNADMTVGGAEAWLNNTALSQIAAGKFYNAVIGSTENSGKLIVGNIAALPHYTSMLTAGGIELQGAITANDTDTLVLHGNGLQEAAPLTVGKLLLWGSGDMKLDSQVNGLTTIAADMGNGSLELKNGKSMTVDAIYNRNTEKEVAGLDTSKMEITVTKGEKITAKQEIISKGETKLVADGLELGDWVKTGTTLTLERYDKTQEIKLGSETGAWNVNGFTYKELIINAPTETVAGASGHVAIKDTTFKGKTTINAGKDVEIAGQKNTAEDLTINAHSAKLPGREDALSVTDLTLNLDGGLDLGEGTITGAPEGSLTIGGFKDGQDIYISDTYIGDGYKISYATLNNGLVGFKGLGISTKGRVHFDEGSLTKSVQVEGQEGVAVEGALTIAGDKTTVNVKGQKFTIAEEKSLSVSGNEANITVDASDSVTLEAKAQLQVEGNNAQLSFTGGKQVALADGAAITIKGNGADVAVNGKELHLGKDAKIDLGNSAAGNFALQADKVTAAEDNTTNITGKGKLALRPLTAGYALTLNNDKANGEGLHITSDQLNGDLFDSGFTSLTLGDAKTGEVRIDGVTSDNSITVQNASDKTLTIGAGGLNVGANRKVTLQTGAIANVGKMTVGADSTLNIYTNNMDNLQAVDEAAAITGTGTLGLATYDGTKSIALGEAEGDLKLTNDKFAKVFGQDFSHYSIGSATQQTINAAGAKLGKDTTLTGTNIAFAGDMDMADGKILTINAAGKAVQSAGRIKADKLALLGGDFALTSANEIGTAAAKAKSVNLSSGTLTVGEVATPDGAPAAAQTVAGITAADGDITLSTDSLTLKQGISGQGILNLQPLTTARNLTVGGNSVDNSSLNLHGDIFGGNLVKDGFKHVYIGREDGTGTVTVSGDLNFVDPTTIRMAGKQGQVIVKENAGVQTSGNDFTITTENLTTEKNSQISTGKGAYTMQADRIDLQGKTYGEGSLNIMPYDLTRNINLGGSKTADSLWLNSEWFSGSGKLFYGYYDINIGNADGTGRLRTGSVDFDAYVHLIQAINNQSTGEISVSGKINTHGKDYTVSSRQVIFDDAHINADGTDKNGDITIEADNITNVNNSSTIKGHGNLTIGTYSVDKAITLGSAGDSGNGLTLSEDLFSGSGLLRTNDDGLGFASITIGGQKAGDISVGNITIPKNLSNKVKLETTKNITSSGALNVDTLDVTAHSVELTGNNKIGHIGNVTSEGGIEMTTTGGMDIAGKIETKTGSVKLNLQNNESGDVTISENGQIVTAGKTPVYIYNENGYFKNKAKNRAITTPDSRYVIYTKDAVENEVGNLVFDFRRYGTDMAEVPELTGDYSGSGFAYQYQPTITIVSTRPYGAENSAFLGTESGYHIVEGDTDSRRHELDKDGIAAVYNARKDSGSFAFETTRKSGANADITRHVQTADGDDVVEVQHRPGAESYGSVNEDGTPIAENSGRSIRYTGANPLNYKVETKFYIVPKEVTVTGKQETREYDGTAYHTEGWSGVHITGFANGETLETAGVTGGIVYSPLADDSQTSGFAQGAVHAGSYTLGIQDSDLQAANYSFLYRDGSLTITPRTLHLSAPSGTRVYGESNEQVDTTASMTGTLVNGDKLKSYAVTAKDATGRLVDEHTGSGEYTMQVEGVRLTEESRGIDSDYKIDSAPGTLTITPRPLLIRAQDDAKVYDGTAYTGGNGLTFNGFAAGEDVSVLQGGVVYGDSSQGAVHAGDYVIGIGGSTYASPNYQIRYEDGNLTIKPQDITVAAQDASKVYGEENPQLTISITEGALGKGDTLVPELSTPAAVDSNVGSYDIALQDVRITGTAQEGDYRITRQNGKLTITPREVLITAGNAERNYGEENPVVREYKLDRGEIGTGYGLLPGDDITGIRMYYDADITSTSSQGLHSGVIHVADDWQFTGRSRDNYIFRYQPGDLTIKLMGLLPDSSEQIAVNISTQTVNADNNEPAHAVSVTENVTVPAEQIPTDSVTVENMPQENPLQATEGLPDRTETVTVRTGDGDAAHDFVTSTDGSFGFTLGGNDGSTPDADSVPDGQNVTGGNVTEVKETGSNAGGSDLTTNTVIPDDGAVNQNNDTSQNPQESADEQGKEQDEPGRSKVPGAIPVLYTDGTDRELDGIYTINYNSEKLAIMPAAQKVTIPEPKEIRKETAEAFTLVMNSRDGSYNVAFGNGIVSIQPEDDAGLAVVQGDRKGSRTVIATGILSAVQDLGVIPDQIRAVYIYTLKEN